MADADLFAPLSSLQWVDREQLKPNDYNPNKVNRENLKLLVQSIMTNGWTLPIVASGVMTSSIEAITGLWAPRAKAWW